MARAEVVAAAVGRAVRTARVEPDQDCRFDPAALAEVVRLCGSGRGRDEALAAVDRDLRQAVEQLDGDATLAAVALRARIEGATTRRRLAVENLQGDVGTGHGNRSVIADDSGDLP